MSEFKKTYTLTRYDGDNYLMKSTKHITQKWIRHYKYDLSFDEKLKRMQDVSITEKFLDKMVSGTGNLYHLHVWDDDQYIGKLVSRYVSPYIEIPMFDAALSYYEATGEFDNIVLYRYTELDYERQEQKRMENESKGMTMEMTA